MSTGAPKKVGFFVGARPSDPSFTEALQSAESSLGSDASQVYLYFIHHGVEGLNHPSIQTLADQSANLFACSYSVRQHGVEPPDQVIQSGLSMLSDLIAGVDEFHSYT